ncbi:MAG: cardiolipin synthase [Lachnospiraceae bacterium]|nr:cardiolipin synthase [Lachnospiraceae bacterium]
MKKLKKFIKFLFGRLAIGTLLLAIQFYWLFYFLFSLGNHSEEISVILNIISILAVIYIINKDENPAYKLAWVVFILLLPILGGTMYLYVGNKRPARHLRKVLDKEMEETKDLLKQDDQVLKELEIKDPSAARQSRYIAEYAGFPIYQNSRVEYFSNGESCYERVLEELKKAEHYIFMEYFIVKEGSMLDEILEILKEKVKQGVEVRFMYDDVGCISELDTSFCKEMQSYGISCMQFNAFIPIVSTAWNNRDHRKILVIDGNTAFTGGFNIADEYVNRIERFGYWKDSGVMVQGEAVWNMTVMFLSLWDPLYKLKEDYRMYYPTVPASRFSGENGFVQPYSDTPLDSETVGRNIYFNMIGSATRYLYITTPYLILDNELVTALCLAAKRGVDVRIITPGIPDKKMIFFVTQSYFYQLISAGVKIYSYTPGFIHAKNVVCDGKIASVGTVNWDYRSFYLHFECGVFFTHAEAIEAIYRDFMETIEESHLVTLKECTKPLLIGVMQSILRVFAPLL